MTFHLGLQLSYLVRILSLISGKHKYKSIEGIKKSRRIKQGVEEPGGSPQHDLPKPDILPCPSPQDPNKKDILKRREYHLTQVS